MKLERASRKKKGKREYLNGFRTREMMQQLYVFFESKVDVPRIRVGKRQTIETLICKEELLFTKFLRDERKDLIPKIAAL